MEAASFTCDLSEGEKPYHIELRGWKRIICVFFLSIENTNILKVVVYSASQEVGAGISYQSWRRWGESRAGPQEAASLGWHL